MSFRAVYIALGCLLLTGCGNIRQSQQTVATSDSLDTEHILYRDTTALRHAVRTLDKPFVRQCHRTPPLPKPTTISVVTIVPRTLFLLPPTAILLPTNCTRTITSFVGELIRVWALFVGSKTQIVRHLFSTNVPPNISAKAVTNGGMRMVC